MLDWKALEGSDEKAGGGARLAERLRSPRFESQHHIKPDSGSTGRITSLWLSSATRRVRCLPGLPENLSGKSQKTQGWGNPSRLAGRLAVSGSARGRAGEFPLELEKPGAGSALRTAERRPGKPRQEETCRRPGCAPRIRIQNPLSGPPGGRASGVVVLGGDFRPALTSRPQPCGRPSPLFRQVCETARFSRSRAHSLACSELGRGACALRVREEGAARPGCGCAEAGPAAAPAQWWGGAGRREAAAPAAAAEEEEEEEVGGAEGGVSVSSGCLFGKWIRRCRSSREGAADREASTDPARPRARAAPARHGPGLRPPLQAAHHRRQR